MKNSDTFEEEFAVVCATGATVRGPFKTLRAARKAQREWILDGHPSKNDPVRMYVFQGIITTGLVSELTDTFIERWVTVRVKEPVKRSGMQLVQD